jgi:hypothetical protein
MCSQRSKVSRPCLSCKSDFFPWLYRDSQFCSRECHRLHEAGRPAEEIFWANVRKGPGCWLWMGSISTRGYGRFKKGRKHFYAHRFALSLALGRDFMPGEFACHGCDNPPCVRVGPGHIFAGSAKDNTADAKSKGRLAVQDSAFFRRRRVPCGESHPRARLTDTIVREIRQLRTDGLTQQAIADRFGLRQTDVSRILSGHAWGHVI